MIAKFKEHFKVRRNVIYERAHFNKRDQKEGESVKEYITVLHELVETCDYGTLRDKMLRDCLVVGIRDAALSDKLQLEAKLTLEMAKKMVRQKEAVKEHRDELTTRKQHLAVKDVTGKSTGTQRRSKSQTSVNYVTPRHPLSVNVVIEINIKVRISAQLRM